MTFSRLSAPFLISLCALAQVEALSEAQSFEEGGRQVDSFLEQTVNRIHDAWLLCGEEFRLASSCAVEESREYVKEEVRRQTDAVIEHVKEKACEELRKIPQEDKP